MRCLLTACAVSPRSHRRRPLHNYLPRHRPGVPLLAALTVALVPSLAHAQGGGGGLATGACCISGGGIQQCQQVTAAECEGLGGVFGGVGSSCTPTGGCPSTAPTGACCVPGTCFTTTEADCVASGGTFNGVGSSCDPFPCQPPVTGACCLEDVQLCLDSDEFLCTILKGAFFEGQTCADLKCGDPPPPPVVGACCLVSLSAGITCTQTTAESCAASGGTYQGDNSLCDASPCPPPSGPIGACCLVGGGLIQCGVVHESICIAVGGTFQGAGTTCNSTCVPGDANDDGHVDINDLLMVITAWGPCPPPATAPCPADVTFDLQVQVNDLLRVIQHWG